MDGICYVKINKYFDRNNKVKNYILLGMVHKFVLVDFVDSLALVIPVVVAASAEEPEGHYTQNMKVMITMLSMKLGPTYLLVR